MFVSLILPGGGPPSEIHTAPKNTRAPSRNEPASVNAQAHCKSNHKDFPFDVCAANTQQSPAIHLNKSIIVVGAAIGGCCFTALARSVDPRHIHELSVWRADCKNLVSARTGNFVFHI